MPDDSRAALRAAMKQYRQSAPKTTSEEIKKQKPVNNAENKPFTAIENIKKSIFDPEAAHRSIYAKTYKEDLAKEAELNKAFKSKIKSAPGREVEAFESNLHVQNTYNKPIQTNIQTLQSLVSEAEVLKSEIDKTPEADKISRFNSLVEQIKTLEKQTEDLSDQKYRLYQQFETKNNVDYTDYFTKQKAEIKRLKKESGLDNTLAYYLTPYSPSKTLSRVTGKGLELKAAEAVLEETERLYKAPTKQEGSGIGNFAKSVKNIASENEFWENIITLGVSDLEDNAVILRTVNKAESGQPLNKDEEILMDALLSKTLISAQREGNLSIGYQGGKMLTESIPFMLSFLATSGVAGGITKGTAKVTQKAIYNYAKNKLVKKLGKEATEAAIKEAEAQALLKLSTSTLAKITPKIASGVANVTAGAAARTPLMPTSYSQFTEDITPTVMGKTEQGYKMQKGMTPAQAIKDVYIEVASEATGGAFQLGIVGKLLNKTHVDKLLNNAVGNRLNQVLFKSKGIIDRAGYNGLIQEIGEEYMGNAARYITDVIDKEEFKDFYSWENQAAMISSFAVMGVLGIIPNEINRKKIYNNYKNQIHNLNLKPEQINELNTLIDKSNYKQRALALGEYALKNGLVQASDIKEQFSENGQKVLNDLLAYSVAYTEKKAINNVIQSENPQIPFGAEVKGNEVFVLNGQGEILYSNSYSTKEEAKEVSNRLNEKIESIHKEQEAKQDISDSVIYDNDEIRNDDGAIYEFNVTETNELPNGYIPKILNEKPNSIHLRTSIEELNDPDLKVVVVKEKYVKQDEQGNPVITNVDNVISVDLAKKLLEKSQLYTPEAEKEIANDIAEKTISNTKIQELEAKNGGIYVNTDAGRMLIPLGSYQILNIEGDEIELTTQEQIEDEQPTTFITTLQEQGYIQNEEFNENAEQEVEKIVPDGGTTEKTAQSRELDLNNPEDELIYTEQKIGKEKTAKHAKKIIGNLNKQIDSINKKIDKETKLSKIADLEGEIQAIEGQIQLYNDYISSTEQIQEVNHEQAQKRTIAESNKPEYKGVEEGQPEAREGEGEQRTTPQPKTDSSNSVKPSEEEAINKKKESDINNTEEPILKSRKEKGIFGNTIEELKKEIDSDNDDNPIGYMHNLGGMGSMSWRYIVKVNNHLVYFESYGKDGEETYVVDWIFEDPKLAEKTAKEYNGEAEEVYYGEENQRWIRFDNLDNALKYVLSLDNKKTEKEQQPESGSSGKPNNSKSEQKKYATIKFYDGDTRTGEVISENEKEISIKAENGRTYTVPVSNIVERSSEKPEKEQQPELKPTEAQKKAGNYKKAHITVEGMDISIENPKGSVRSGTDEDGKAWEHVMNSHYGYFLKTEGKDGDHIDVFVSENPTNKVFVVDQINPKTKEFDESKVMLGYNSIDEAKDAYMENYDANWQGFGNITEVGLDPFKKWLYDGSKQRKPFAEYKEVKEQKPSEGQLSLFSITSLDQSLTDLSSEERVKIVQDAIEQINDGKKVIIIDDMFSHLETKFKDSKVILERINNLRKINGDVTGFTIGDEITLNSNQATINKCIAAFEHERQHVENKEDKVWNDIKNDIAENIDNETLQKEVSALSGNSFYEGLSNNVLADEYIAYVIQKTFEGKEIKSSLKYKNIIQDEYRKRNGERLSILGRGTYPNIDAERRIGQNIVDNETGENRFLGSVSEGQERERIISEAKENGTYLKAPNGKPTNLNESQWVQVRTKAFKEWFGDWENDPENASKVVDENGEPHISSILRYEYEYLKNDGVRAAKNIGMNQSSFYRNLKKYGINPRSNQEANGVSTEQEERGIELYKNGMSTRDVAKEIGVNKSSVTRWVNKYNIARTTAEHYGITISIIEDVLKEYNKGYGARTISKNLGISDTSIYRILKDNGIDIRSLKDAQSLRAEQGRQPIWGIRSKIKTRFGNIRADSVYEAARISQLNLDDNVSFVSRAKRIPFGNGFYTPDLLVEYVDGTKIVEEIKPTYRLNLDEVIRKKESAINYYGGDIEYKIVTENEIGIDGFDSIDIDQVEHNNDSDRDRFIKAIRTAKSQIKSATDNTGEFSESSDDIRFKIEDSKIDSEYFSAIERGDMEEAQRIVDQQAVKKGYVSADEYKDAHVAPSSSVDKESFRDLEAIRKAVVEDGDDTNVFALANGISNQPDDYFSANGARWYGYDDLEGRQSASAIKSAMRNIKYQQENYGEVKEIPMITVYRTVTKDIKESSVRNGDWVTPSENYAKSHGEHRFGTGQYRIIKQEIPADNLWWDGNDINEWGVDDGKEYAYQNTKNNKKLTDVIVRDDNGEIIPPSKRFNKREDDPRFSIKSPIGFYSTVENALLKINQEKGTPEQFKAMLLKNGAKQAELDWMDYDGTFTDKTVTKDEIQQWIDENKIQVEEVEKDSVQFPVTKDDVDSVEQNENGEWVVTFKEEAFGQFEYPDAATAEEAINLAIRELRDSGMLDQAQPEDRTKYSQYQLPGGENYKELLLTMPSKYRSFSKEMYDKYGEDWINNMTEDELKRKKQLENKDESYFQSSHFDESNILAHVRFNERTDKNGDKVLFIEELQSDWAQKGKKEGFKGDYKNKSLVEPRFDGKYWYLYEKETGEQTSSQSFSSEAEAWKTVESTMRLMDNGVPNMPFRKTDQWVNLAIRRMMRYAAEKGFDRIAWTNGEQQADRYDLSKQVDKLAYQKREGGYFISAMINGVGNPLNNGNTISENKMEEYVGKDVAEKIINGEGDIQNYAGNNEQRNEFKELSGTELKVGGEGMKGFYDGIVPSAMSKLGKPFGAKVETIEIEEIGQQQSIPITKEMKESVMQGIPLFAINLSPQQQKLVEVYIDAYNSKDYPTFKAKLQDVQKVKAKMREEGMKPFTNKDLEVIRNLVRNGYSIEDAINHTANSTDITNAAIGSKQRQRVVEKYKELKSSAKHKTFKESVKDAVDFAKNISEDKTWGEWELMDEKKRIAIKQILTQLKNAATKKDINRELDRMFDIIIERQNSVAKNVLDKALNLKISDTSGKGVRVGKNVDDNTRVAIETLKENLNKGVLEITSKIKGLSEKLETEQDELVKNDLSAKILGLRYALLYDEVINGITEEISESKEELNAINKENKKELKTYIRENMISLQNNLEFFINEVTGLIQEGIAARKAFLAKEELHNSEILNDADLDLKHVKEKVFTSRDKNFVRTALLAITSPLRTFSTMLKEIGKYFPEGKGYLYKRFVEEGIIKAAQTEYLGIKEVENTLAENINRIFGKKYSLAKLANYSNKSKGVEVKFKRGKISEVKELNNGHVMYIYMVNKMADGKMKLREMGITEADVEKMKNTLSDKAIEFCDYVQDELLPALRKKYNKTHVKLFGIQMDEIENYFPLKIAQEAVKKENDLDDQTNYLVPSMVTGSIIRRKKNKKTLNIMEANAIDVLQAYIKEMERWNAYAFMIKDLNFLNSSLYFKNKLNSLSDGMANRFFELSQIAVKKYSGKRSEVDEFITKASKFIAASKIAFRLNTAIKQILGLTAYSHEISDPNFLKYGLKNMIDITKSNIKWCKKNLPMFEERWKSRTGGDDRLSLSDENLNKFGNMFNKISSKGMIANAFVDLIASSWGAKTMYDTKYAYYKKRYPEEIAKEKALVAAENIYNETQQSGESLYLSKVQSDRTFMNASFSLFNNASFSYGRQLIEALRGIQAYTKDGKTIIENKKKMYIREGLTEENAEKFAKEDTKRSLVRDVLRVGVFGYIVQAAWNIASDNSFAENISNIYIMLFGDDDDKEKLKEEKSLELKKGLLLGFIQPVRGLIGGKELESLLSLTIEGYDPDFVASSMRANPLGSDIMQFYKDIIDSANKGDWMLISNALLTLSTSFTGSNINSIYNSIYAIYDFIATSDVTIHDVAYDLGIFANIPKSKQKSLALTPREGEKLEDYIERYVKLKRLHKYGALSIIANKKPTKYEETAVAKEINYQYDNLNITVREIKKTIEEKKEDDILFEFRPKTYLHALKVLGIYSKEYKKRLLTSRERSILQKAYEDLINDPEYKEKID